MFNVFRSRDKSVRIVLGVLLGLVTLSMLVYLIPGGPGTGGVSGQNVVAVIGDDKVTSQDVQRALDRVTRSQANLPRGIVAMYIPSLVNQLIEGKAMAYKAREMGLRISDEELSNAIQAEFAAMLGGKFDMNTYQMALTQIGMTPSDYEKERRENMLSMRLENLEAQSLVVSDADAKAEYARRNKKVSLEYIAFTDKDFSGKVKEDPAAIKSYFDTNRALFRTTEKRDGTLVVGSTASFLQNAKVSDAQIAQEYKDNIDTYRIPERVQVRHILIKTQGKPKEDAPKLKAKAQDLLKQLQGGADFAALAKKNSEDPGSAEKGGDLGWVVRGQTVPNFEKAAFSLKPGQLSDLVETEYGYHILQVEAKQEARTQTLDEVKGQIGADLQKQAAADQLKRAMDDAREQVAKNPASVQNVAQKYGLQIIPLHGITAKDTLPEINAPELSNAVFSSAKGSVTDVVSVDAQGKSAFAAITSVVPARNAEYNEVQGEVAEKYRAAQAAKLMEAAAQAASDRAKKGEPLAAIAKSSGLQVKTAAPFTIEGAAEGIGSASLLEAAFSDKVGDIVGPVSAQSSRFVCRVSESIPADLSAFDKDKAGIVQSLQAKKSSVQAPLFRDSVVSELKQRGKIKTNDDSLNRLISSYRS
ncbi:MAG: peptidylprolyl isomerase [Mucilaginibacter polytrichastri]|nr:peptidylprolyl isomerase [Mucilaginibacter polytrichastri]